MPQSSRINETQGELRGEIKNRLAENLFLTAESDVKDKYKTLICKTADVIVDSITDDKAYKGPTPEKLKESVKVSEMLPAEGLGFETVLERIKTQVLPNMLRTFSTDYMAHLHSAAMLESIATELIISTFNQSMDSWDQSPAATEIEVQVIDELCRLYGLSDTALGDTPLGDTVSDQPLGDAVNVPTDIHSGGTFTSGGSQSNETALLIARDWFCNNQLKHDVKKHGLPENFRKFRLYTSCISHFSMEKTAHILGLGYESVVKVPVDSRKKMDMNALRRLVKADVACGNLPFCVVATVGTTDFGSIDPIDEIKELCQECGMWLHADAAYGSGVILSEKYKYRVAFLSKCDSITVDFHKMFMQPISCSTLLLKDNRNFDALTIHADYLNRTEDEEDGYTNLVDKSIQTTRRFDALKVWVSFQTRGLNGWSSLISTCIENAQYLYSALSTDPEFEVVTEPEISSVVFRIAPDKQAPTVAATASAATMFSTDDVNRQVRRRLIHEHGVVIGQTVSDGNVCLKFTLLNPLVTHQKLDSLITLIKSLKKECTTSKV